MSAFSSEPAFSAMFEATSTRVYAYARRHADVDVAPDIVGEVYLIAWQRRRVLPEEPLPWLLVTARNVLHRYWRHRSKQQRLATGLAGIEAVAATSEASVEDRLALAEAFARLSEDDRETLLLVGWDGLTPKQAAEVLGCSANTFAARLSRARRPCPPTPATGRPCAWSASPWELTMSDLIERTKPTDEGLAGPIAFPGWFTPNAAAEELGKVATAAGERARLEWAEGQFLRVSYADTQNGPSLTNERTPLLETRNVTFVDFDTVDGWTWSDRVVDGKAERYIFPPTWGWLRPDYATMMPTEPHLLDAFLRTRVTGSTSQDEAVFVAIGDMLRQEAAPPAVRAAAIGVLGLNPKVTVEHTTDPVGRPALKVVFVDEVGRPGVQQFLFLAPDSGLLLANGSEGHGGTYQSVIRERTVVDALPTDLVALLGTEKEAKEVTDGQTTPIQHGTPPVDPQPGAERTEIYTPAPKP